MALFVGLDARGLTEVDADAAAKHVFAVEELADADSVFGRVEGDDDAAEGFEWAEVVEGSLLFKC